MGNLHSDLYQIDSGLISFGFLMNAVYSEWKMMLIRILNQEEPSKINRVRKLQSIWTVYTKDLNRFTFDSKLSNCY